MTIKPQMNTSKKPMNTTGSLANVTEMIIKPEISTSPTPLNGTTGTSTEHITEMTIKPISTSQALLDVTTDTPSVKVTEMFINDELDKSAMNSTQKPSSVFSDTSTDNVTEVTTKSQMSTLKTSVNLNITSSTSTEYIVSTTDSSLETFKNNTEDDGFLNFFSMWFNPYTSTTSNTQSRLLEPQPREHEGVTAMSINMAAAKGSMETITRHTNTSDLVTREPNPRLSNISLNKTEIEHTPKITNTIGSNYTKCKKGFILNQRGGCEVKIETMSNSSRLLKIVQLSQKLKPKKI
ncbi:mucin-2-like isoform X2 [Plodia interpunctella]|nr:uncharacterized protein LOC128683731 isoform X2 [Plodia interpunctella]